MPHKPWTRPYNSGMSKRVIYKERALKVLEITWYFTLRSFLLEVLIYLGHEWGGLGGYVLIALCSLGFLVVLVITFIALLCVFSSMWARVLYNSTRF